MIDFSLPAGDAGAGGGLRRSGESRWSSARRGSSPSRRRALEAAAGAIPLLISPNLSRAVNLLMRLVGEAARALGDAADIEIVERHHHFKKDAPSGTALRLAEIVGRGDRLGPVPSTAGTARSASGPGARSASTPCAPATTPASTRSSSA